VEAFVARRSAAYERARERQRALSVKDVGRRGAHWWVREAWTWYVQHPEKVFILERLRLARKTGTDAREDLGPAVGGIEYRIAYFGVSHYGSTVGQWRFGQFAPMIPAADWSALLQAARRDGTLLPGD
jgi:hypothetical protein